MFRFNREKDLRLHMLREENLKLARENHRLRKETNTLQKTVTLLREDFRTLQLLVKEYQEMLFKKKALRYKKKEDDDDNDDYTPKKKGAPNGHPGKTRKVPDRVDEHKDVHLFECPECSGKNLSPCKRYEDHYQEDIVIPQTRVTRFRHHYYYCHDCKKAVHGIGEGELPGSYIGPNAKSLAGFLHYHIAIPYRKIKLLFKEMFNMDFDFTSCIGFDSQIRARGQPLYERLKSNLKNKPYLHVDETGWVGKWLWCYGEENSAVYKIENGRGQKELRSVLGDRYSGVLISDFLGAYNRIRSVKQRCLVHVLRHVDKWLIYYDHDRKVVRYFTKLKTVIKEIILLSDIIQKKRPINILIKKADLVGQLRRLLNQDLEPPKANKFRRKLLDHFDELIACLNHPEISAHNNFVERLLRGNVIMRKITFGNRSEKGILNHEVLMSLIQTARLQKLNPLPYLHTLLTDKTKAASLISLDLASAG